MMMERVSIHWQPITEDQYQRLKYHDVNWAPHQPNGKSRQQHLQDLEEAGFQLVDGEAALGVPALGGAKYFADTPTNFHGIKIE